MSSSSSSVDAPSSIDTADGPRVATLLSGGWSKRGLRIFSKLLCCVVAVLLFLGANVKSNEAGLAVPDWPTSYGYNMFTFPISYWVGGIFHEHVHRLAASLAGFLTLVLAFWTYRAEKRRRVRLITGCALIVVVLQGLLGGLTVMYRLPVWTSSMHGTLAQLYFCLVLSIAYFHSAEFERAPAAASRSALLLPAIVLMSLLIVQLIFGNVMRHSEAALAVPDFPTMGGSYLPSAGAEAVARINEQRRDLKLPPVDSMQVLLHLIHRLWAIAVLLGVGVLVVAARSAAPHSKIRSAVAGIAVITGIQILLGIFVVLSVRSPVLASLHVLTGALLLGATLLTALRARYL